MYGLPKNNLVMPLTVVAMLVSIVVKFLVQVAGLLQCYCSCTLGSTRQARLPLMQRRRVHAICVNASGVQLVSSSTCNWWGSQSGMIFLLGNPCSASFARGNLVSPGKEGEIRTFQYLAVQHDHLGGNCLTHGCAMMCFI